MSTPLNAEALIGIHLSANDLKIFLRSLCNAISQPSVPPEVKSYTDVVYFNYRALGLSMIFIPALGSEYKLKTGLKREELHDECLVLDSIDIYNTNDSTRKANSGFASFPITPITLWQVKSDGEPFKAGPNTIGKEFVEYFGEPERKGGGSGPSSGSIGIWCEWTKYGVLVELGGDEARGPQAWEKAKDGKWRVLTIFKPGASRD